MQLSVDRVGDVCAVTINEDQLDAGNSDDFRQEMAQVVKDCRKLVIDFSCVEFVDSRGCGAILSCLKQLSINGGDLKLCNVNKSVRVVFELIRLHRICEIVDSKDDAVRAFE